MLLERGIDALDAVHQATASDDAEVRSRAWHIIDLWAAKGEIPALLVLLEQAHSPEYRLQAIDALGRMGPDARDAVPALTRVLDDQSEFVHRMARDALGKIQPMPVVRVEISDANDPIAVGEETSYDIQVTNDGTAPATDLRIVARVPKQMTVTQVHAPANNEYKGQRLCFEPISLDPQTSLRYRVHVKAIHAGDACFRVQVTLNESAAPVNAQETTTISPPPPAR